MSVSTAIIAKLRELTPGAIYGVSSLANIKFASKAFSEGHVLKFSWDRDGKLFASYGLNGAAAHEVEVSIERERLKYGCTCGWEGVKERCHHTVTALMSICYILRGSTFNQTPPKNWLKSRSDELLAGAVPPPQSEASAGDARVLPALIINADASLAKGALHAKYFATDLGANAEVHQAPEQLRHLLLKSWPVIDESALRDWLSSHEAKRLPVYVQYQSAYLRIADPKPMPLAATTEIANQDGTVAMRRAVSAGKAAECVRLGERLCFDASTNCLADIDPAGWNHWLEFERLPAVRALRESNKRRGIKSDPEALPLEHEQWNMFVLDTPYLAGLGSNPEVRLHPQANRMKVEPKWEIRISESGQEGCRTVKLHCVAGGANVPYGNYLTRIFDIEFNSIPKMKGAWDELWETAADWLDTPAEDRGRVVGKLADTLHSSEELRRRMVETFDSIGESIRLSTRKNLHAGIDPAWFELEDGIQTACRLVPPIYRIGGMLLDREDYAPVFTEQNVRAGLGKLTTDALRRGVSVYYGEREARLASLSVRMDASAYDAELDWFEMRPEVYCDGELVPIDKWRSLLQQGYWEKGDTVYFVDEKSTDTLARVDSLLDPKREKNTVRMSRLAIFDWLAMRRSGVECELPKHAEQVLSSLLQLDKIPVLAPPKSLRADLRHYQIEGFSWLAFLYQHRFGACLADDMGLGKTIQTIAFLAALREGALGEFTERGPHLIVLPPTLLFNWRHEVDKFCPGLRIIQLDAKSAPKEFMKCDILLCSYEMARRRIELLEAQQFHVIVFDEAQAVKNLSGGRSQAMRRLNARFKICLTGTPLENHAGEYYAIMDLALPGLFGSYETFRKLLQNDHVHILDRARPFVLRRKKETILLELPEKTESDVLFDLTDEQKSYYTRAVADVRREVAEAYGEKTGPQAGIVALAALTRLRQICVSPGLLDDEYSEVSPKLEFLCDSVVELRDEGHAALIFSQFTSALDLVEAQLKEREIGYLRLDGSTPMKKRQKLVEEFQNPEGPSVFLISLKTGGVGLNLTRADYVFHLDPWWNPAAEAQASDRAHRMGQRRPVLVQRLLMRGTVEEKILELKNRKRRLFEEIVEGGSTQAGTQLTRQDFEMLLDSAVPL